MAERSSDRADCYSSVTDKVACSALQEQANELRAPLNRGESAAASAVPSYKDAALAYIDTAKTVTDSADPKAAMAGSMKDLDADLAKADKAYDEQFSRSQAELNKSGGGDMHDAIKKYNAAVAADTQARSSALHSLPERNRDEAFVNTQNAIKELKEVFVRDGRNSTTAQAAEQKFGHTLSAIYGAKTGDALKTAIEDAYDAGNTNPAMVKFVHDVMPYQRVQLLMRDSYSDLLAITGNPQKSAEISSQERSIERGNAMPRFELELGLSQLHQWKNVAGPQNIALDMLKEFTKNNSIPSY